MEAIRKEIINARLSKTLNLHVVINLNLVISTKQIEGNIMSFKEDKITTSLNENGLLMPDNISKFVIPVNIDEDINIYNKVTEFLTQNITTLVSA